MFWGSTRQLAGGQSLVVSALLEGWLRGLKARGLTRASHRLRWCVGCPELGWAEVGPWCWAAKSETDDGSCVVQMGRKRQGGVSGQ